MTIKEAISTIQRILITTVEEFKKQDAPAFAQTVDDAWKIVREAALKGTCNMENRPNDEEKADKGMFIPEGGDVVGDWLFKTNVDHSLNQLNKAIMQNETEITMLWDAVNAIKERPPRE